MTRVSTAPERSRWPRAAGRATARDRALAFVASRRKRVEAFDNPPSRLALETCKRCRPSAASVERAGVVDLITAAIAEHYGVIVLHDDCDSDYIAAVTGQQTQWVVPTGTAD